MNVTIQNQKNTLNSLRSEFIFEYVKQINLNDKDSELLKNDITIKLKNLEEEFKFRYTNKKFNYFENNVIFNILSFLNIDEYFKFAITSQKYNNLIRNFNTDRIYNLNKPYQSNLIKIYPNLKFKADLNFIYSNKKKINKSDIIKFKNAYILICDGYKNKILDFIGEKTKYIDFRNSNINTIKCKYNKFDDIKYLNLSNTSIFNNRQEFSNFNTNFLMGNIIELDLSNNYQVTNSILPYLLNIKILHLDYNYSITDISVLSDSKCLKHLSIAYCDYIKTIDCLTDLKSLNIDGIKTIPQEQIDFLEKNNVEVFY